MNPRHKAVISIVIAVTCMITVIYGISQAILLESFGNLEEQTTIENVERVADALSDEVSDLDTFTYDWAAWDDTYAFIEEMSIDYVESNLLDETFIGAEINLMVFVNSSGQSVFSKAFDLQNETEIEVPQSFWELLFAQENLWLHNEPENSTSGIILLPEGPMIIASRPIITSENEGPVRGALIMGRYLDSEKIESLAARTHLSITLHSTDDSQLPADFREVLSLLSDEQPTLVLPLSEDDVAGYSLVKDVKGSSVLLMRVDMPRDIYKQGQSSLFHLLSALLVIGLVFGITSLLSLEKLVLARVELKETRAQLLKAERLAAIGELAAIIGHDLRNPLTGIAGASYYLRKRLASTGDKRMQKMFEIIEKSIEYSNKIINNLLDYSREMRLELSETNPKSIMKEALSLVEVPPNIEVSDLTRDKPRIRIDQEKIVRVFVNLINNAIDAMPEGGQLTLESKEIKRRLIVTFTDTGTGISKDNLERIWAPLFTTKAKGIGLGLSICKRIVEAHKGHISVDCTVGKGTTFTVAIPLKHELEGGEEIWMKSQEFSLLTTTKP